jgi:uncharacterized membrane protein
MNRARGSSAIWAIILGIFMLIEGIWGMTSTVVFMFLTTNMLHATIHIVLGILGLWTGLRGGARGYCHFVGGLLLLVGILYFLPVVSQFVVGLLNVNFAVSVFNIVVGLITLAVARSDRSVVVVDDDGITHQTVR